MLYTDYTIDESPVVCGDCGSTVPLYKLPKILGEDEYWSVLNWQRAYKACDELFMVGIGERFAYQRISKPANDLYELGKQICEAFENAIGKPFYYYLFRYYSPYKGTCPVCGLQWKLGSDNKSFINYRCDYCRLVGDSISIR
jgi:predicted  nucleic acid-binding Zn ribbon protein